MVHDHRFVIVSNLLKLKYVKQLNTMNLCLGNKKVCISKFYSKKNHYYRKTTYWFTEIIWLFYLSLVKCGHEIRKFQSKISICLCIYIMPLLNESLRNDICVWAMSTRIQCWTLWSVSSHDHIFTSFCETGIFNEVREWQTVSIKNQIATTFYVNRQ